MKEVLTINGRTIEKGNPKYMAKPYGRFLDSADTELRDVYTKWSDEKEKAFKECRKIFTDLEGNDFTIVSRNGWSFTVGFTFNIKNEKYFCYMTANHKRCCKVSELNTWL